MNLRKPSAERAYWDRVWRMREEERARQVAEDRAKARLAPLIRHALDNCDGAVVCNPDGTVSVYERCSDAKV